jgi:hypothetical protein
MSEVISQSVFSIDNNSSCGSIRFSIESNTYTITPGENWSSPSVAANATVPFSLIIGDSKELSLQLNESADNDTISVINANGWTETSASNPYVFTYGTAKNPPTFTITVSDNNPGPDEIGILIVGTTECDPEENK